MSVHEAWSRIDRATLHQAWSNFLGRDRRFPREIMVPSTWLPGGRKRWIEVNAHAFNGSIMENAARGDVWVASRPAHAYYDEEPTHTRLWLDVDAKVKTEDGRSEVDLHLAYKRMGKVWGFCLSILGVEPYVQFSANSGFHLHVDHPGVVAQPEQYREAIRQLLRKHGVDPDVDVDMNVVGNLRAMPRPPYTANTGSVGSHGALLFTIPVSLDDSVESILQASREVRVGEVRIPYASQYAADLIQEAANASPRVASRNGELTDKGLKNLCLEAIRFCRDVGPVLKDGRKRILRHLMVPAALYLADDDSHARALCREFVERSGVPWAAYRTYVESQIRAASLSDGRILYPMRLSRFLTKHPEIVRSMRMGEDSD